MSTGASRRSPLRGRFYDELSGPAESPAASHTEAVVPVAVPPVESKTGVDEANYRLLIQQLVLCNDEIERLMNVEEELIAENAKLKRALEICHASPSSANDPRIALPPRDSGSPQSVGASSEVRSRPASVTGSRPASVTGSRPASVTGSRAASVTESDLKDVSMGDSITLRPYLGIEVMDTGSEVVVKNILPGGGADEAGVQVNDVLVKWNGRPINSRQDFGLLVSEAQIGSMIKLQVERGPQHQSLVLRVEVKGTAGPRTSPSKPTSKARHIRTSSGPTDLNVLNGALN